MISSEQDSDSIIPSDEEMLAMARQFVFTDAASGATIRVERRTFSDWHDWVAINEDKFLLNDAGSWEWKPVFVGNDEDFIYHTGFRDARCAIVAARKSLLQSAKPE